jgi:hypothetical protein
VGDKDYDSDEAAQIRHFNSQATSILLASLCREKYNKVQGLMSHPVLRDKAGCISYMRQEDNIYNNRVYRDDVTI